MLRIKELRESKKLNMKEAARLLDMPYTTYVNYEKGKREPTSEVLIQLADFFETTVDFLVGRNCVRSYVVYESSSAPLSEEDQDLLFKYHSLDERGKSAVLNVLNHEYDSLPGEKAKTLATEA